MKEFVKKIAALKVGNDSYRVVFQKDKKEPLFLNVSSEGELNNIIQTMNYISRVDSKEYQVFERNEEDDFYQYISQKLNAAERTFISKAEFLVLFENLKTHLKKHGETGCYSNDSIELIEWRGSGCKTITFKDKEGSYRLDLFQDRASYFSGKERTLKLFEEAWQSYC